MAATTASKYGAIQAHRERDYYVTDHAAWRWKDRMPAGRRSVYTAVENAEPAYGFERHEAFTDVDEVRVYSAVTPHGTRYDAVLLLSRLFPQDAVLTTYRVCTVAEPALRGMLRHVGERGGVVHE